MQNDSILKAVHASEYKNVTSDVIHYISSKLEAEFILLSFHNLLQMLYSSFLVSPQSSKQRPETATREGILLIPTLANLGSQDQILQTHEFLTN